MKCFRRHERYGDGLAQGETRSAVFQRTESTPDHSTISRTRRLMPVETHKAVFRWFVKVLGEEGLMDGQTITLDATMLEANAALRSIRRRDDGRGYDEYLKDLAQAEGIEEPTREQAARLDRKRKKKASDTSARIAGMKDGRAHLAHKAEHAVDLSSGAVVRSRCKLRIWVTPSPSESRYRKLSPTRL